MPASVKSIEDSLRAISNALSLTLNQTLERFKPDRYMQDELKKYLAVWGNRPLHDFVQGVVACGDGEEPDVWNGDMKPFNILQVLDILYRS